MMFGCNLELESLLCSVSSVIAFVQWTADCLRISSLVQHIHPDMSTSLPASKSAYQVWW